MRVLTKLKEYIKKYKIRGFIRYLFLVFKPSFVTLKMREAKVNYIDYNLLKRKYSYVVDNYLQENKSKEKGVYNKIIWSCWFQGEENAPTIVKTCWDSMRRNYKDYELIIITENNMFEYADFPYYICEKYRRGIISKTHLSDILRLELLTQYGGIWFDATVFCTDSLLINKMRNADIDLFFFSNIMRNNEAIALSSWFLYAKKDNAILMCTKKMLYVYWKENNYLCNYFLMHILFTIAARRLDEELRKVPIYSNINAHLMQNELFCDYNEERFEQLKEISDIHKLSYKFDEEEYKKQGTIYKHIITLD